MGREHALIVSANIYVNEFNIAESFFLHFFFLHLSFQIEENQHLVEVISFLSTKCQEEHTLFKIRTFILH